MIKINKYKENKEDLKNFQIIEKIKREWSWKQAKIDRTQRNKAF